MKAIKCIYHKSMKKTHVIICLYDDNLLIFSSNLCLTKETKNILCGYFDMKDLGETNFIFIWKLPICMMIFFLTSSIIMRKCRENIILIIASMYILKPKQTIISNSMVEFDLNVLASRSELVERSFTESHFGKNQFHRFWSIVI